MLKENYNEETNTLTIPFNYSINEKNYYVC